MRTLTTRIILSAAMSLGLADCIGLPRGSVANVTDVEVPMMGRNANVSTADAFGVSRTTVRNPTNTVEAAQNCQDLYWRNLRLAAAFTRENPGVEIPPQLIPRDTTSQCINNHQDGLLMGDVYNNWGFGANWSLMNGYNVGNGVGVGPLSGGRFNK